jgi:hypothetical protein
MNREPRPASQYEHKTGAVEIPLVTQKTIAKLWVIHDSLKRYQESAENCELLLKVINQLHVAPLPTAQVWDSPEESWLRQQVETGFMKQEKYHYVLDCMTSEARYEHVESWSNYLREGIAKQESEVPLSAEYEKDSTVPPPYERIRKALNILPDNPDELVGSVWIDRATNMGLIPAGEKKRYLDIFLNIREKAEFLRDEEKRKRFQAE